MSSSPETVYRSNAETEFEYVATTEEPLFEYEVPALHLTLDRAVRARVWARRVNTAAGAVDITYRVKYGATTLWADTMTEAAGEGGLFFADLVLMSGLVDGASQKLFGAIRFGDDTVAPTTGEGAIAAPAPPVMIFGDAVEDATVEEVFSMTFEADTTDADSTFTILAVVVEQI